MLDQTIQISGMAFDPPVATVDHGNFIDFVNADDVDHRIVLGDPSSTFGFDTGVLKPLATDGLDAATSVGVECSVPGEYEFHCTIHPEMKGWLTVK